jgi:hypothetical protein
MYNPTSVSDDNKGVEMAENWSLSQEEEDLHRQGLFRRARKGTKKPSRNYKKSTACDSGRRRNGRR